MHRINEATDTDLKVIEILQTIGWKRSDTLLYQQEFRLLPEQINLQHEIVIDIIIAGGINPSNGKKTYYQTECIQTLIQKFREKKHNMLVHMATVLGKTCKMVAFVKALLEYDIPKIRNNYGVYTRIISISNYNSNGFKNDIYG